MSKRKHKYKYETRSLSKTFQWGNYYLETWEFVAKEGGLMKIEQFREELFAFIAAFTKRWLSKKQKKRLRSENISDLENQRKNLEKLHAFIYIYIRRLKTELARREEVKNLSEPQENESSNERNYSNWSQSPLEHSKKLLSSIKDLPEPLT